MESERKKVGDDLRSRQPDSQEFAGEGEPGREPRSYAFQGRIIRLTQADFDRWRSTYPAIPNLTTALQLADDYYAENPPKEGKWFFPVSRWLKKDNDKHEAERPRDGAGRQWESF